MIVGGGSKNYRLRQRGQNYYWKIVVTDETISLIRRLNILRKYGGINSREFNEIITSFKEQRTYRKLSSRRWLREKRWLRELGDDFQVHQDGNGYVLLRDGQVTNHCTFLSLVETIKSK